MFLHQSAYRDQNLYCAGYPGQMHQDWTIQHRDGMDVNTHIRPANWWFRYVELRNCYRIGQVECRTEVGLAVCVEREEVQLVLRVSNVSVEFVRCHFGKEGIRMCGLDEASPGFFLSQPAPLYAPETQNPTSSLCGPRCEVSWSHISSPLLRHAKTLLWPFWPYSRPGTCRTVPAVPDLHALP